MADEDDGPAAHPGPLQVRQEVPRPRLQTAPRLSLGAPNPPLAQSAVEMAAQDTDVFPGA